MRPLTPVLDLIPQLSLGRARRGRQLYAYEIDCLVLMDWTNLDPLHLAAEEESRGEGVHLPWGVEEKGLSFIQVGFIDALLVVACPCFFLLQKWFRRLGIPSWWTVGTAQWSCPCICDSTLLTGPEGIVKCRMMPDSINIVIMNSNIQQSSMSIVTHR